MNANRLVTAFVVVIALATTIMAENPLRRQRTFSGTYVCLACDLAKKGGAHSQCDIYGHQYCLKLNNGNYVMFLRNDYSEELLKGGGREDFKMKVTGVYDPQARTIDVRSYEIDGIKSTWCDVHERMDDCAAKKDVIAEQPTAK